MKVRRLLAIWTAKLCSTACRLAGKQGVTLAGKLALRIDPDILRDLASQVREKIFVVCGTNGKTTTNNLLCSAIESEGKKLVCNHTGSNMLDGVVAAFVLAAGNNGRLDADYASIEIDEASTVRVFPHFKPDFMVLTNLFRDQLDRYGEIDITMNLLDKAMKMAPEMKVIANGDDALSWYLAMESGNPVVTYGITEQVFEEQDTGEIREGRFCKRCGERLEYEFYHYSQLGRYCCPKCGFARPDVDFEAARIDMSDGLKFDVREHVPEVVSILESRKGEAGAAHREAGVIQNAEAAACGGAGEVQNVEARAARGGAGEVQHAEEGSAQGGADKMPGTECLVHAAQLEHDRLQDTPAVVSGRRGRRSVAAVRYIAVDYKGFYNIYNILAAYSAARTAGLELDGFDRVLREFNPQNGRMEKFQIQGTEIILNLAKNPAGFNQNISAVMEDPREKDLIIVINDNAQDGTDISWLWDVDFDRFAEQSVRSITVSGIRCQDMRLRLKYVDIPSELVADVETAIRKRIVDGCGNLYVLVNYTALYSTRNILAAMQGKKKQEK